MGKYERRDIELMEKSVARILNCQKSLIDQNDKWYRHLLAFVNYIKKNFPNLKKAEYIGNKYGSSRGDIKIYFGNQGEEFIELKASESEKGKNTLANISQNAVTVYGLIKGKNILSWSEFRNLNDFEKKVKALLNRYSYPRPFDLFTKARFIRKKVNMNDLKAIKIKKSIFKLAKQDKKAYIKYIEKFPVNEESIKKFIFCLVNGIHTGRDILSFTKNVDLEFFKKQRDLITTLYGNVINDKIIITKAKNKIGALLNNYENFHFSFPAESGDNVYTYLSCQKLDTKEDIKIIGLVFHWKNIFQGIKTPCINVFLTKNWGEIS